MKLQTDAHRFFVDNLRLILSNAETAEKFQPFRRLVYMGTVGPRPFAALENHQEYQRRLFQEARLFNTEPLALAHLYVDTDCSLLRWGEINSERKDPFDVKLPRLPLLSTVMDLIRDRGLDDAIVIQGVAGAGKSSFTLRLCRELTERGFRPIRIRLRDVPFDMNLADALPRAVLLHEPDLPLGERGNRTPDDLFLGGNLFRASVVYNGFNICPWVLILDGWDEISLSSSAGFRLQVTRMLRELRQEYLKNRSPVIRVIITGRPSVDVTESHFLLQTTPVLTIRALAPDQLDLLMTRLVDAVETAPLGTESAETPVFSNQGSLQKIRDAYAKCFSEGEQISGSMEVFSLPLLAHLAMRLVSVARRPVEELLKNSTHLYRNLVDEIVWRRGRLGEGAEALVKEIGPDFTLRSRLRETAAAVMVYGQENIPARELAIRLGCKPRELEKWAQDSSRTHFLTDLLINFFFKGGNEKLGCEFLHKSFREYLFAEYVVEVLKDFGKRQRGPWPERSAAEYWKDFPVKRPLWILSRSLGDCLSAQWMSEEVYKHVLALIEWEVERSNPVECTVPARPVSFVGSTEPLSLERWEWIRDALADLWDWWGEGVHLRRQVGEDERGAVLGSAYVDGLVANAAPAGPGGPAVGNDDGAHDDARWTSRRRSVPAECAVHHEIAKHRGWWIDPESAMADRSAKLWDGVSDVGAGPRRYQTSISQGQQRWIVFAPSGDNSQYFDHFASRINAVGWRPRFPSGIRLLGVDFRQTGLDTSDEFLVLHSCNVSHARIVAAFLVVSHTVARQTIFASSGPPLVIGGLIVQNSDLEGSVLSLPLGPKSRAGSHFFATNLRNVNISSADFTGWLFRNSPTEGAKFTGSHLESAEFDETSRPREGNRQGG